MNITIDLTGMGLMPIVLLVLFLGWILTPSIFGILISWLLVISFGYGVFERW